MDNSTVDVTVTTENSSDLEFYYCDTTVTQSNDTVRDIVYYVIVPLVCALGIVGNSFNLIIFTRRRMRHRLSTFEKASITGLTSLSVSDLMFCVILIVAYALEKLSAVTRVNALQTADFYFRCYNTALINTFLFSSTWIITCLSLQRLAAVKYPFVARQLINNRRAVLANIVIYVISVLFNVPKYLQYEIMRIDCGPNGSRTMIVLGWLHRHQRFAEVYSLLWNIIGTFVPMVILFICNIMFIVLIYKRKRFAIVNERRLSRANSRNGAANSSSVASSQAPSLQQQQQKTMLCTTLILVIIILMFFLLVCPSMIINSLENRSHRFSNTAYRVYTYATVLSNLTQAINFSVNFILYFAMSRDFRRTFRRLLCDHKLCCCKPGVSRRRESNSMYTPVSPNCSDTQKRFRFSFKSSEHVGFKTSEKNADANGKSPVERK